jgi:hypothetical protein
MQTKVAKTRKYRLDMNEKILSICNSFAKCEC